MGAPRLLPFADRHTYWRLPERCVMGRHGALRRRLHLRPLARPERPNARCVMVRRLGIRHCPQLARIAFGENSEDRRAGSSPPDVRHRAVSSLRGVTREDEIARSFRVAGRASLE